jgi:hypothetical protein
MVPECWLCVSSQQGWHVIVIRGLGVESRVTHHSGCFESVVDSLVVTVTLGSCILLSFFKF